MMVVLLSPKMRFSSQYFPPFCENKKNLTTIPFWYHNQVSYKYILFSDALNISVLLVFLILLVRLNEVSLFFAYGLVEFIHINLQTHRIIGLYADVDQLNYRLNMAREDKKYVSYPICSRKYINTNLNTFSIYGRLSKCNYYIQ